MNKTDAVMCCKTFAWESYYKKVGRFSYEKGQAQNYPARVG
jgi:hypothetical protein